MALAISNRRRITVGLAIGVTLCVTLGGLSAQTPTPQIAGVVRDSSGAVVRGAKITLNTEANAAVQSAATNEEGRDVFSSVKPGRYILYAVAPGFGRKTWHVTIEANGHPISIDFSLEPSASEAAPPISYDDQSQMKPSEMNMAIDAGGHSSPGPATTNTLIQGMSALKAPTSSAAIAVGAAPSGSSEDNLFDQGNHLLMAQKFDPAIDVFSRGANRYPQSVNLHIGLGVALYARARYGAAAKAFCDASDLSPSDPRPYFFLARLGDSAAASSAEVSRRLQRYVTLQPQSASAHYYYAMDLWRAQRDQGQVNSETVGSMLKKAIELDATLADAHLALGNLYFDDRDYPRAIKEYQTTVKVQPDLTEAHYHLAQAYRHTGDEVRAQQELELHERLRKNEAFQSARDRAEIQRLVDSGKEAPKQ